MEENRFYDMLARVAQAYNTTPEIIRDRIIRAISEGQQSPDPQIRALWESVPHTGKELTLSDYVVYLAQTLQKPFSP